MNINANSDKKLTLGKQLLIWLGSFAVIGTLLFFYMGVPLAPLLASGALTLIVTMVRHFSKK